MILSSSQTSKGIANANVIAAAKNYNFPAAAVRKNDLNIPPPAVDGNAILRMEVELRDKHQAPKKQGKNKAKQFKAMDLNVENANVNVDVSMEKVCESRNSLIAYESKAWHLHFTLVLFNSLQILDDLLRKLELEHVVWYSDKGGNYYQVIFPVASGEPCETALHCLVELGIGKKFNSSVR